MPVPTIKTNALNSNVNPTNAYGVHWMGDFYECQCPEIQWKKEALLAIAEELQRLGFDVLGHVMHEFSPQGATCVILLGESHCSIHTWPEHQKVALDCYTCRWDDEKEKMMKALVVFLKERWNPARTQESWVKRI